MHWKLILIFVACLLLYAGLGGIAFHFIETNYENALRPTTQQAVLNYINSRSCLNLSEFWSMQPLLTTLKKGGLILNTVNGQTVNASNWDIASGIYAASQIVGTVGYGRGAPQTVGGKVFLVFYACIGIPLFFVLALGLSHSIVKIVRFFENRFCGACALGDLLVKLVDPPTLPPGVEPPRQHITLKIIGMYMVRIFILFVIGSIFFVIIPAAIFNALEVWGYGNCIYYAYTSVLSVGFGDFVPGYSTAQISYRDWYRLCLSFYLFISIAFFVVVFSPVKEALDYRQQINKPLDLHEPDPIRIRIPHRPSFHHQHSAPAAAVQAGSNQEAQRWLESENEHSAYDRHLYDAARPSFYPTLPPPDLQQNQVMGDVTRLSVNGP